MTFGSYVQGNFVIKTTGKLIRRGLLEVDRRLKFGLLFVVVLVSISTEMLWNQWAREDWINGVGG